MWLKCMFSLFRRRDTKKSLDAHVDTHVDAHEDAHLTLTLTPTLTLTKKRVCEHTLRLPSSMLQKLLKVVENVVEKLLKSC